MSLYPLSAAPSTLNYAPRLVLPILRRVWVVAVAVAVADGSVLTVDHDFNVFPDCLVSSAINGIALRVVTCPNTVGTLLSGGPPAIAMWYDMDVSLFAHVQFPSYWPERRSAIGQVVEVVPGRVVVVGPEVLSIRAVDDANFRPSVLPRYMVGVRPSFYVPDRIGLLPGRPRRSVVAEREDVSVAIFLGLSDGSVSHIGTLSVAFAENVL